MSEDGTQTVLQDLAATIRARRTAEADASYTRQLLDRGPLKCAKKLGEEAVELALAAVGEDDEAVIGESADLLYHLLVLLEARQIPLNDVLAALSARQGISGVAEKAARGGAKG